jgi:hypothetical protein
MKPNIWRISLFTTFVVAVVLALLLIQQRTAYRNLHDGFTVNQVDYHKLALLDAYFNTNISHTGEKLNDMKCSANRQTAELSGIIKDRPMLVFRYANVGCTMCIDTFFDALNEIFGNSEKSGVLTLCSYQNEKDFYSYRSSKLIKHLMYLTDVKDFTWEIEKKNVPYMFVLHPDLSASNFYIPDTGLPELNRKYLTEIKHFIDGYRDEAQ